MSRISILSFLSAILLLSCMPEKKKEEVTSWQTINSGSFTLKLPSSMKKATDLHDDAVLQYQNPIKELYCIVIQESVASFDNAVEEAGLQDQYPLSIDGYANFIGDKFTENVDEMIKKSELKKVPLKNKEGRYFEANAKVGGVDIHYHYGFVKGDTTYYQVLSWTLMSKEEKLNDTMYDVLRSFKEK